ncbi:MAG: 4Fe-4S binding protein [Deltaproteobacteria bacterium]|nr:4Fe-4S binding protein [Deltaproteobacteria bacterium]
MPSTAPNARPVLAGNQASARGAQEAGAQLAIGYPGTPATLAIEYLLTVQPEGMRVQWAVNEKVALEVAAGHSWAGQRSYAVMKMSGLNVASDALLSIATSGTRGGLVLYVGDDPGMYYGMVEQDSRLIARLALLPMIEPATPEEHRTMTAEAFEVSEQAQTPVMLRGTTITANTCGPVDLRTPRQVRQKSHVPIDLERYTKAGAALCLRQHEDTLRRLEHAGRLLDHWNLSEPSGSPLGVIASGSVWPYVREALDDWPADQEQPNLLRVAVMNPLPEGKISSLLARCRRVLVLEELEPLIEERVRLLAAEQPDRPEVLGKRDGLTSAVGDFDPEIVGRALASLAGLERNDAAAADTARPGPSWATRTPTFCAGCPHRSTYAALAEAIERAGYQKDEVVVTGDVGCTILGMNAPYSLCRTEVAMGSSIALAQGFAYAGLDTPVVATIGDSTFFHAGIPPLLNAAAQNLNLTVLILDNGYASMTGYQPSLGNYQGDRGAVPSPLSIEELVKAARVRRVRKALPYFNRRLARVLAQALRSPGVQVIIAEAPCVARRPRRTVIPYRALPTRCLGAYACPSSCLETVGCPALDVDESTQKVTVDGERCMGCGLCASACRHKALKRDLRGRRRTR